MKPILPLLLLPYLSSIVVASTIDATNKYAWAANAGWVNFLPSQEHGADVNEGFLANYAWAANVGWIHLGDGTPDNGYSYSNTDGADTGVNLDSDGNLSGLAWSQNAAWINFGWAAPANSNRPRIDLETGEFLGYAWAANLGWIQLGGGDLVTATVRCIDLDEDGIGDHWEMQQFGNLETASGSTDTDEDGDLDRDEYLALSNPNDSASRAHEITISLVPPDGPTGTSVKITVENASPSRGYDLITSVNLSAWEPMGTTEVPGGPGLFELFGGELATNGPKRFYRVIVGKGPLAEIIGPPVYVWETVTAADPTTVSGTKATSLAIDPAGMPYIAYGGNGSDLYVASFDGTSWNSVLVDNSVLLSGFERDVSLAIDGNGYPAVAYYDAAPDDLLYASFDGTSWSTETVVSAGDVGEYCSLAFDASGNPAIAFFNDAANDLQYASHDGTSWTITDVDTTGDAGRYCTLAFSPTGEPAIAYKDGFGLNYAVLTGGSWQISTNLPWLAEVYENDLAFDPVTGHPAIVNRQGQGFTELFYLPFDGSEWGLELIDCGIETGRNCSLAFGPNNLPSISFHDGGTGNGNLSYATYDGTDWTIEILDEHPTFEMGRFTSLAFRPDGHAAISSWGRGEVRYTTRVLETGP